MPAGRFQPENGPEEKRHSLGRANAAKFVERLCKYPGDPNVIKEAERHILEAHAERLTDELAEGHRTGSMPAWVEESGFTGERVTYEDIAEGRTPRPRVLDMFAGGGAIPLEALRLGCEAYALELNPVAHIIELCTLVYPQKYGKPDPSARGMTGPKNDKGETTWGGLAEEVRYWGNWVLECVKAEIGDLYPPIPDPDAPKVPGLLGKPQAEFGGEGFEKKGHLELGSGTPGGYLTPVAYLWTRTVRCKNPACGATVPLVKQTWLCKKKGRYLALKMAAPNGKKQVRFRVVESATESGLGFDPHTGSSGGNSICPFCGTVADSEYLMSCGNQGHMEHQLMGAVCLRSGTKGKVYLSPDDSGIDSERLHNIMGQRLDAIQAVWGLTVPNEPIGHLRPSPNARGLSGLTRYGFTNFGTLFSQRQQLMLLTLCNQVRLLVDDERSNVIASYLALLIGRVANQNCAFTVYHTGGETIEGPMGDKKVPMVWDFVEANPFSGVTGGFANALEWIVSACQELSRESLVAAVSRGSATSLPWPSETFDAVITDPPYYDSVPYADIADVFYVWLKRALSDRFPEHFASSLSPKKSEATVLASRFGGDMPAATKDYETKLAASLKEAHRVLKTEAELAIVYAHKTTLGWATLVDALRHAGFTVQEAWPIETEMKAGKVKIDRAMLASSIFLSAQKRNREKCGNYEDDVRLDLRTMVQERVSSLWDMGVTGADLVIAAVGAGLRAFTRYERVEYANGEEVPAEKFLTEVEAVVLDTLMERISGEVGRGISAVDSTSRFYVLWRYVYKATEIDAGEAIVFTYGQHVELDGQQGLSNGRNPLVEKKKVKYRVRDYTERGDDDKLGLSKEDGTPAPLSPCFSVPCGSWRTGRAGWPSFWTKQCRTGSGFAY